ncbi:MAG: phosphate ABC transporter permease PstA [Actinomycetota bacterium]|nr:phosphate ABC transporter permease PstA [Actinomycetota bacterium]
MSTRRRIRDNLFWGLCFVAFALIVAPALSVLISVFHQAAPSLSLDLLTKPTEGDHGGLRNAILGTLMLLLGVLIIAGTVGVSAGVYLAEFASPRVARVLRFFSEVLAGMPSIVIGYVGYLSLVIGLHWKYSLMAALLALSVLVVPYIVKTTEVALSSVPVALREGSAAMGLSRGTSVGRILLPTAAPGIVSGLIVALAISTGETAPLLFTAGFLDGHNPTFHLFGHDVPYLTYVTFTDLSLPTTATSHPHQLAAAAGAVTLIMLIVLIVVGRVIAGRARRKTARMAL